MDDQMISLKEQRLQKLFDDCQHQVLSQIIGPFGLSMAMFEDKNGGNVTTLHNFSRDYDEGEQPYVATEDDRKLYAHSREEYSKEVRDKYELTQAEWDAKRDAKIAAGVDEYTGYKVDADGRVQMPDGGSTPAELDHVVAVKAVHGNKKAQLGLAKVVDGEVNVDAIKEVVNDDRNLALTNKPLNASKWSHDLKEWEERPKSEGDGKSNAEHFGVDKEKSDAKYETATEHVDSVASNALLKKQATELLQTGGKQAALMGMRQALGLLLTELVNGLFNEFKVLIKQGVEAGKTLFEEIRQRLARVIESVVKKIPDAVGQMFQGGVSGFMSNLLTFLINNFLSTAKRFVTVIREGLLGLFRAFKMIFLPPKHMTGDQALQEGLKILTTVVVTAVGLLLNETVATFMATVPFLKPFADLITPVLIGIMTGLLSAFLAYQIDCLFDRYRHSLSEKFMDELLADAKRRDEFANELVTLSESSLGNIENYSKSITLYQSIGVTLGSAGLAASATLASLEKTVAETGEQVAKSFAMIEFINESQSEIEDFLKTL
ncbi:hypothetical protein [Stutzerimonas kunmingensis]|uniref:hypothetical protein n=1 Tax=Stutzerimonas kunmingensis TaxID=1211807 RepID=UPI00289D0260|nr:hypothetical protein [Stutzerimonas kunmingensis]